MLPFSLGGAARSRRSRLVREPGPEETVPRAYLLAAKPA
jgi:hypothetical protein